MAETKKAIETKREGTILQLLFPSDVKPCNLIQQRPSIRRILKSLYNLFPTVPKLGSTVTCDICVCDLGDLDNLKYSAEILFKAATKDSDSSLSAYDQVIFVNNAGSLGTLAGVGTEKDSEALLNISKTFAFNVTSSCYLTAEIVRLYHTSNLKSDNLVIINISSLAALQPFETWSVYCAGKSARNMFHQVLALETASNDNINILNYAPGPLDTDMQAEIRESETINRETREYFRGLKDSNTLVQVNDSAAKMVKIILSKSYVSGCHIDYYDEVPGIDNFTEGQTALSTSNPKTDITGGCTSCGCSSQ